MNFTFGRTGWSCPGCRRCYSPDVQMCWFCPGIGFYVWPPVNLNPFDGTGVAHLTVGPEGCGVVPLTFGQQAWPPGATTFTSPTAVPELDSEKTT